MDQSTEVGGKRFCLEAGPNRMGLRRLTIVVELPDGDGDWKEVGRGGLDLAVSSIELSLIAQGIFREVEQRDGRVRVKDLIESARRQYRQSIWDDCS